MHYDGACGNVHGHNMDWEVTVGVMMDEEDDSNMPVDLKEISDCIDQVDHACLLNENDVLENAFPDGSETALGDVITFEGDPTCEVMSEWMARQISHLSDAILYVDLVVYETDKYGVSAYIDKYSVEDE